MDNNLMKFEGEEVEVFEWNGKILFNPKHVAKCLDIKNVNDNITKMNEKQVIKLKNSDVYDMHIRKLNNAGENFLTESGVYKLVQNCHSSIETKQKLLEALNLNNVYIDERKEISFVEMLEKVLCPFSIKGIKQFKVLNYRIDYYIPDLDIAIEYDENNHRNYSYRAHEGRQKEIEKELGCRFIRVSDKNSNEYNIGLVIKEIFNI